MGCPGYSAYRHRGYYFVTYHHCSAYPTDLGCDIWARIPVGLDDTAFDQWVGEQRACLDKEIEGIEGRGEDDSGEDLSDEFGDEEENGAFRISLEQPAPHDVDYTYEINLDFLIFHVQTVPIFNLRNMPPTGEKFVEYLEGGEYKDIPHNYFGHISPHSTMPAEYRWDADLRIPIPSVDQGLLEQYTALKPTIVDRMVDTTSTHTQKLRSAFVKVLIYRCMKDVDCPWAFFDAKTMREPGITPVIEEISSMLLLVLLEPPTILDQLMKRERDWPVKSVWTRHRTLRELRLTHLGPRWRWLRDNLCVSFRAHLDDQGTLKAAVVEAVQIMHSKHDSFVLTEETSMYAVIQSISHCVIVAYERNMRRVKHSPVMQLLPSFYSDALMTEGVAALGDLCMHLDSLSEGHPYIHPPATKHLGHLPIELLARIAFFLGDPCTLVKFASASMCCKIAAKPRLMLPIVDFDIIISCNDSGGWRDPESVLFDSDSQIRERGLGLPLKHLFSWSSFHTEFKCYE